eukprot:5542037-Alexandrium_andersonii.AAC.1
MVNVLAGVACRITHARGQSPTMHPQRTQRAHNNALWRKHKGIARGPRTCFTTSRLRGAGNRGEAGNCRAKARQRRSARAASASLPEGWPQDGPHL